MFWQFQGYCPTLLPTLISSWGLKKCDFTTNIWGQHHLYVDDMHTKFRRFIQTKICKIYQHGVWEKFHSCQLWHPSKDWGNFFVHGFFEVKPSLCWLHVWKFPSPKNPYSLFQIYQGYNSLNTSYGFEIYFTCYQHSDDLVQYLSLCINNNSILVKLYVVISFPFVSHNNTWW